MSADLAATFLVVLVVLAVFGLLGRYGMKWFVPGLIVQSVLLAAAGERLPVVAGAVALIVLLAHVGMRPSRRQVMLSLALTMATVLGITGYRGVSWTRPVPSEFWIYRQDTGCWKRSLFAGTSL